MAEGTKTAAMTIVKAGPEDGLKEGQAMPLISVYDVFDSDDDRIKAGEFNAFVSEMKEAGDPLPVIFAHQHRNLDAYLGDVTDFDPDYKTADGRHGLAGLVTFDLDDPGGRKAYKLAKGRRLKQWSYHWTGERVKAGDAPGYDLKNLKISEVSLVLRGANALTDTLAIKAEKDDPFASVKAALTAEQLERLATPEGITDVTTAVQAALASAPAGLSAHEVLIRVEESAFVDMPAA